MSNETMKVHSTCIRDRTLKNVPESVPMSMLNEDWAKRNHDQSLDTLNSRGGLGITELLANIHKTKVRHGIEKQHDVDELNELIQKHISMNTTPTTKAKPTLIICEKHDVLGSPSILIEGEKPTVICEFTDWRGTSFTELDRKERDKYKTIFHEAGTVYHEIKLTPRELVERYNEAIEALKEITSAVVSGKCRTESEVEKALIVINKATE